MFDDNGKLVIPCTRCERDGVQRAAGTPYVAGMRGMPMWLCPEHGGNPYATGEGGN